MRKGLFVSIALLMLIGLSTLSCKKYTTPNKVKKSLVKDSWRIQTFFLDGNSITADFSNQALSFDESGGVLAKGVVGNAGAWSVGLNKNPATLFLSNFLTYPLSALNKDWTVDSCSKKEIKLSGGNSSLTLVKV